MARYFFDSSALVKRYHQESRSADVEALFNKPDGRFLVSRLAVVEIHSALARLVREQLIDEVQFGRLVARLAADVGSRVLTIAAVSGRRLDEAARILSTQGLRHNVRTLDAIHLANAQALNARAPLSAFVAADKRLVGAAHVCGLKVIDLS